MSDTTANVLMGLVVAVLIALVLWGGWLFLQAVAPHVSAWYASLTFEDVKFIAVFALVWAVLK